LGMPAPEAGMSLPEYLLDVTNPDFTEAQKINELLDAWNPLRTPSSEVGGSKAIQEVEMHGLGMQTVILGHRLARMTLRDPSLYFARWIFVLFACTIFALVYKDAHDRTKDEIMPRVWLLAWSMGAPAFMSVVVIAVYNMDFHIFEKEVRNGMYRTTAYVLSQTMLMIPSLLVLSLCALLPLYALVGYTWSSCVQLWLAHATCMLWAECLAQLLAVASPHYLLGMVAYIGTMFIAFLESGIVISIGSIMWPLRWIAYINPWLLCLRAAVTLDFRSASFHGFGPMGELKGSAVLDGASVLFSSFGNDHDPARDIGVALAIAVAVKLVQYILLCKKARL